MQMFGERRERAAGRESLLEKTVVGRVRSMEGPADRYGLTQRIGVHPRLAMHLISGSVVIASAIQFPDSPTT